MSWLRSRTDRESGFTLIEMVVAIVVLGAVSIAVIGVIMSAQAQGVSNRNRIAASNLAARELDIVRAEFSRTSTAPVTIANQGLVVNANPLAGGSAGQPLVVDGTSYRVERSAGWNITGTGSSACEGGSLVKYPTLAVRVRVTWPNMGSVKPVETSAMLTPDKDTGVSETDSFVAAKVQNQAAQPLSGIAVQATGAGGGTGVTDASGCAVVKVTPAAAGTTYNVSVADANYRDLSGATNPSKTTGLLKPGQIYTGASFTVALPGTVRVTLVRSDGQPLADSDVAGSQVSLVAAEFSGASGVTTKTVTGVTSTFPNLWPTTYGAYFGSVPPAGGYTAQLLTPGATITLQVVFEMATLLATDLPPDATKVLAVPAGTAPTCAAGVGTSGTVSGSKATFQVLPGLYDLYVSGTGYECSPGPVAVSLGAGANDGVTWGTTTLRLDSVPTGGSLWALNSAKSGVTSLATCPGSAGSSAVSIDGARSSAMELPAGTWFVYQTSGSATAACSSYPTGINPVVVAYDTDNTRSWSVAPVTVTYAGNWSNNASYTWYLVAVPYSTPVTCSNNAPTATASMQVAGSASRNSSLSLSLARPSTGSTTYTLWGWRSDKKCTLASTVAVTSTSPQPSAGTFQW